MAEDAAPLCDNAAQVRRHDGRRVRQLGTYQPVRTLKKMPRPGRPREELELGAVVIELAGSAADYDPAAPEHTPARIALGSDARSSDEIARVRDRRVAVEGRLVLADDAGANPRAAAVRPSPVLHDPTEPPQVEHSLTEFVGRFADILDRIERLEGERD